MIEYLGDSVYAEFDSYSICLFLNNGEQNGIGEPLKKNPIYLEPAVFEALLRFKLRMNGESPS